MSISKNQIKFINSLHVKKNRKEEGLFFVEGEKIVEEVLNQNIYKIDSLYATSDWYDNQENILYDAPYPVYECSLTELEKISALSSPNKVFIILKQKEATLPKTLKTSILLDNIQDPGNMGTIIRIADWFGIDNIFCSEDCAEHTNPKVLQASMGSFLRVNINYVNLREILENHTEIPCYAAVLNGQDARQINYPENFFLLIGNESKGISAELSTMKLNKISIPRFGLAESLNAAVATGILCALIKN